jgi:hypothetical protein
VTKPPLPTGFFDPWPRIPVDETDGGPFHEVLRLATFAADEWTFGPDGPYKQPRMTPAQATRGQIREGLLHLLELGLIDIDAERLNAATSLPMSREKQSEQQ